MNYKPKNLHSPPGTRSAAKMTAMPLRAIEDDNGTFFNPTISIPTTAARRKPGC